MAIEFLVRYGSTRGDLRAEQPAPVTSARAEATGAARSGGRAGAGFWGADGFTFGDVLDLINPLQHIPVVGAVYRAITGDEIAPGARIFGGALFGGVAGLAGAVVNAIVAETSGRDLGAQAIAFLDGEEGGAADAPRALAAADAPAPPDGPEDGPRPLRRAFAAADAPPAGPVAEAEPTRQAREDEGAKDAAPVWLSRIPRAKEDAAALAARYAAAAAKPPPNAAILDAMARALDKYEAAGGLIPRGPAAPAASKVDSLL